MLRILQNSSRLCDGINRREWLRIGSLGLGGLTLPGLNQATQAATAAGIAPGKAKRAIVFFLTGGPPQMDTWDPKPEGPSETRGPFGAIQSRTPGMLVGSLMPKTALLTDKIAVMRAVVTGDNAHSSSGYQIMTGEPHVPLSVENATAKAPNFAPHMGAVLEAVRPSTGLPGTICLPRRIANVGEITWPGQSAGILPKQYDPWMLNCDPSAPKFKVPEMSLPEEVPALRFDSRRTLLDQLNSHFRQFDASSQASRYSQQFHQALDVLRTGDSRGAFDMDQEDPRVRDRYGRSKWGQSVLLARRLVEAGVSLVQVNWSQIDGKPNFGSWDTHEVHNEAMKDFLGPMLDESFSALITDLDERGMLDDTLVYFMGEFGRTPKINPKGGRDHWGPCFSLAMAGGGIRGGVVHGASDAQAALPVGGVVKPCDLIATLFNQLGIPPETLVHDIGGRPHPVSRGRVISEIL